MQFRTPLAEIRYYLTTAVQGVPIGKGAGKSRAPVCLRSKGTRSPADRVADVGELCSYRHQFKRSVASMGAIRYLWASSRVSPSRSRSPMTSTKRRFRVRSPFHSPNATG
jgi:hypothetical protein